MNPKPGTRKRSKCGPSQKTRATSYPLVEFPVVSPRPAFRVFSLEDEQHGRRRLRGLGKYLDIAKFAPHVCHEALDVYLDATGDSTQKWFCCVNLNGEIIHREPRIAPSPEEAARDLLTIAKAATLLLTELLNSHPQLCQSLAGRQPNWPVLLDLTEKNWQRHLAETINKLGLGKEIKGYIVAARTADENVIRCWSTAIYETLYQTRFEFKRALQGENKYATTEGCPEWARKTLDLPPFTKSDSRNWARLGEEMLLQQKPDFLDSPDLAAKKQSWSRRAEKVSRSGRISQKAVQRQAFDDFAKELKNLAPERTHWRGEW